MENLTDTARTLPEIADAWASDRAARPVLPSARRRGFDSFLTDDRIVDPMAARRQALGVDAPSPGAARLDAVLAEPVR